MLSDQITATEELKMKRGQLTYLQNLAKVTLTWTRYILLDDDYTLMFETVDLTNQL